MITEEIEAKGVASEIITCGTASTLPKGTEHEISQELCTKFISEADVDVLTESDKQEN